MFQNLENSEGYFRMLIDFLGLIYFIGLHKVFAYWG